MLDNEFKTIGKLVLEGWEKLKPAADLVKKSGEQINKTSVPIAHLNRRAMEVFGAARESPFLRV
jgi:hypothetical protein